MSSFFNKTLADKGYTALVLPSDSWKLLTLAFEHRSARGHTNSIDSLVPGTSALTRSAITQLPTLAGVKTASMDLGFGLKLLSGLISTLGGNSLGLDLGFKSATKVTYSYDALDGEEIDPIALDGMLRNTSAPTGGLLADFLSDHLWIVTTLLRAKKVKVEAESATGAKAAIDVPAIANLASGNLKIDFSNAANGSVVFESLNAGVPIAVKIFQVRPVDSAGGKVLGLRAVKDGVQLKATDVGDGAPEAWDDEGEVEIEAMKTG